MSSKKNETKKSTNFAIKSRYNRNFSEAYKRSKVDEIQPKVITISQLCTLYEVSRTKTRINLKLLSKIFQMKKESLYKSLHIKENLRIILIKYPSLKIYNGLTLGNLCYTWTN